MKQKLLNNLCVNLNNLASVEILVKESGWLMYYGFASLPFGEALISWSEYGIHWLSFVENRGLAFAELKNFFANAEILKQHSQAEELLNAIFNNSNVEISIVLSGSEFQLKVWQALIKTPSNQTITYSALAKQVGLPKGCRAVATAVGKNNIAYLVPCHRVIQSSGAIGAYRWGRFKKQALLLWEKY